MGLEQQPSYFFTRALTIAAFVGLAAIPGRTPQRQIIEGIFSRQSEIGTSNLRSHDYGAYYYLDGDLTKWRYLSGGEVFAEIYITGPHSAIVSSMELAKNSQP